jgi:putative ABC transport system ATP-binding protein
LSRIRARSIGFVLQTGGLLPYLDVGGNISLNRRLLGLPPAGDLIDHLVQALEIDHLRAKKPQQLSIGERQRVSIARALAHQPVLLLADEPTAALDPVLAERVMDLMLGLVNELGSAAVIATHEADRVRAPGVRVLRAMPVYRQDRRVTRFAD